ncbi:ABC transporter permease [Pelosinus baikalensis]|uniref:ABC transporter permease n=1 Tax=Pelosinus baikalensis TaxID=2892015 RepID=A0ABS8HSU0_9FIRM|nr:ABC transporter permease [Pelosinus baikalensis]MCC5465671.1 ABC transporter permease [Pelosinus baikalensis]
MLKLIKCEFWKLKRKKFVNFVVLAAFLFPIPFTALVMGGSLGSVEAFEGLFGMIVSMGESIMLPCVIGIIASMLFFMERDNDTLKNLRVIPISTSKIATAKILVLFILGFIFSMVSVGAAMIGGVIVGGHIDGIIFKLGIAAITGVLYTAGTLPVIIAIVFFNRSYIFSIIITLFYTMFNYVLAFSGLSSPEPVMKLLTSILPTPTIYRWQLTIFTPGTAAYSFSKPYFLSLQTVSLVIAILAGISYFAIIQIYRKHES